MGELICPNCDGPLMKQAGSKSGERLAIRPNMSLEWAHPCGAKVSAQFDSDRRLASARVCYSSITTLNYVNGKFVREENGY